jgi:hypothetical protein
LDTNLPHLAQFNVEGISERSFVGLRASAALPGFGFLTGFSEEVVVLGARESLE